MTALVILGLMGVSLGLSAYLAWAEVPLAWEFAEASVIPSGDAEFETVLDYDTELGQAHSPSILVRADGFSVLWFEGSAEAQADVDLFEVSFAHGANGWQTSEPVRRVTRGAMGEAMSPEQLVVTLGNTIQDEDREGGLFATVVSVGGWAMASVARVAMGPNGPVAAQKLNLSPMINRSILVKSPMVEYAGGDRALPAYFEMGQMHGLWVRFAPDGRVRDARRMDGAGLKPIQPMVVPLDACRAVAFLRDFDTARGTLLITETEDGGQSWAEVRETRMFNPSAPVAALPLGDGRILMAANDDADAPADLRLLMSVDGGASWTPHRRLTGGEGGLRYPMLRRLGDGRIGLSYSHGTKRGVRVHVMSLGWIEAGAGGA